jgi:hypothetical protein
MSEESQRRAILKRYILGELTDAETEQVEERYFAEAEWLELLHLVCDELLEAWFADELPHPEAAALKARLCVLPALREKAVFTQTFYEFFAVPQNLPAIEPEKPAIPHSSKNQVWLAGWAPFSVMGEWLNWRWGFALASILLVLGVWVVTKTLRRVESQRDSRPIPAVMTDEQPRLVLLPTPIVLAEPQPDKAKIPVTELAKQPESKSADVEIGVVSFVLSPRLLVRAEKNILELAIDKQTKIVRLQLELEELPKRKPQATLLNPAGAIIWQQDEMALSTYRAVPYVVCDVSAALLSDGEYSLRLSTSVNEEMFYSFRFRKL